MRPKPLVAFLQWLLLQCCSAAALSHSNLREAERTSVTVPAWHCSYLNITTEGGSGKRLLILQDNTSVFSYCDLATDFRIKITWSGAYYPCSSAHYDYNYEEFAGPIYSSGIRAVFEVPLSATQRTCYITLHSWCNTDFDAWVIFTIDDGRTYWDGRPPAMPESEAGSSQPVSAHRAQKNMMILSLIILPFSLFVVLGIVAIWRLPKHALAQDSNILDEASARLIPGTTPEQDEVPVLLTARTTDFTAQEPAEEAPDPLSNQEAFLNL